jgi:tRNA-specific 2-thiouridylase
MKTEKKSKVVLGMSGGVDSSVAALLLKEAGYEVIGLFMQNWHEEDEFGECTAAADFADVKRVADKLGIPAYSVNFEKEYYDKVFSKFISDIKRGRTPNPDVLCNREIKFGDFREKALEYGADYIATGHYAQVEEQNGCFKLLRAVDGAKDQTYFLNQLNQEQLAKTLFPIGHLTKPEIRGLADQAGLATAKKRDSTGICFIGERNFNQFICNYITSEPGEIRSIDDERVIGEHQGLIYYTLGQRKGIGVGGQGTGEPWFVAKKDLENNILYVVQGENHHALFTKGLIATELNWIAGDAPAIEFDCTTKFRYRQPDQAVSVKIAVDGNSCEVIFATPQKAITPGQSVVFYQGQVCLGGGVIDYSFD